MMHSIIIAAICAASVVAVPFVPNDGQRVRVVDTTCTKDITTTVMASSAVIVTASASSEVAAVSSTTVEEHHTRKHHHHDRPHGHHGHHHGHRPGHHGKHHGGHHGEHHHPSPSPSSSTPSSTPALSSVPIVSTPAESSIIIPSESSIIVPSESPSSIPAPSPSSATPTPASSSGWGASPKSSVAVSSTVLSSMPPPAPASSSQVIASSQAAESSHVVASSQATASSQAMPTSETHDSSGAGATQFPYPSGTLDMGGWTLTYSAPTQTTWTAPSGNFISSEHVTSYALTSTDSWGSTQVTTTTTTEAACTAAASDYVDTAITMHNELRANHSANALVWDDSLACIAQRQANACIFDHLMYVDNGGYGQNIAGGGGVTVGPSIDMWYGEAPNYAPYYGEANPGGDFGSYGHFTQLVWAYSTSVGCASVDCGDGNGETDQATGEFTVCNYFGAGNFGGEYGIYVLPQKS